MGGLAVLVVAMWRVFTHMRHAHDMQFQTESAGADRITILKDSNGDGRILAGLVTEETPTSITLVNSNNESFTIARDNIGEMETAQISQMLEESLHPLTPQQRRDLVAYL